MSLVYFKQLQEST